jgi:hypothetical protein
VDKDWHKRYGHILLKLFSQMDEAPAGKSKRKIICEDCAKGNSTKAVSRKQTQIRTSHVLKIHLDLCGSLRTESFGKNRHILNIIDGYSSSRIIFTRGLRNKDAAEKHVMKEIKITEAMADEKLHFLQSDEGGKFRSSELLKEFKGNGSY